METLAWMRGFAPGFVVLEMYMLEQVELWIGLFQPAWDWFFAQPLPVQLVIGVVALATLWVSWILLRVVLVAFRAAFRGL